MASSGFKMYNALALPLRQADASGLLERFMRGPQSIHERIEGEIQSLYDQVKPDKIRGALLQYLKDIVGFGSDLRHITDRLDELQLRRLIQVAVPLWNERSTERGLVSSVRLLTGRTAFMTTWFGYRNILGETGLMEDQLAAGGDNWIIGGSTSVYDEYWSNIRIMDDGTLDELLLIDVLRLMRPSGERFEICLEDFLDKFDGELDKWTTVTGTQPTIVDRAMVLTSGAQVQPVIPLLPDVDDHHNYNIISKFRLDADNAKFIVRWFIDDVAGFRYDLEIQAATPQFLLRRYNNNLVEETLYSGDFSAVSILPNTWYKLRVSAVDQEPDAVYIQAMIDGNLLSGDTLYDDPGSVAGPYRFAASGGPVSLDNVESWRNPMRRATIQTSTIAERGGAVEMTDNFVQ